MDKRALAIGGRPATGKTTLVRAFIDQVKPEKRFKYGLLRGLIKGDLAILGVYQGQETFAGTDKLSMAVQADYDKFVANTNYNLLFEGDRLFTLNNLVNLTDRCQTRIIVLEASDETLAGRHLKRKDTQTARFKKSRQTKIANIQKSAALSIETARLTDRQTVDDLVQSMKEYFNKGVGNPSQT